MVAFLDRSFGFSASSIVPDASFPTAEAVDLDRYMRDWYVIAHIPPKITRTAHNSIERYRRGRGNQVDVTFTFRKDGFDGEHKTMNPTGFVVPDTGNAVWAMQFIWPIKMQFVIAYVDADYSMTIVARERRDFVWIMAATPEITEADYQALVERVRAIGYDMRNLRKVPQQSLAVRG
ncbi:lipocalin family protein [uncultured Salinisphaera sp.]|uniref:lipocalin family protein n=1 Tax=uncultured Salinisphaera sp. TaxID=359372 RepID=UPI0032B28D73|tara:strand:- start:156 stop:686 length:531 start_codon:yes stop_codon:yes gene_type:complete